MNGTTKVLYDIRTEDAPVVGTVQAGVGGMLVGVLLLLAVWSRRDRYARVFALLWIVGWGSLAAWAVHGISSRHADAKGWIENRAVEVVEGKVEKFFPATADQKGVETFQVAGRFFRIVDGQTKLPGLNRSSVRGGPVRGDATMRITFHGTSILRVEELAPPAAASPAGAARGGTD